MGKSYEEFKQELRREVMKKMEYTEEQVYYKVLGKGDSRCERLMVEVKEREHSKEVCGIWIKEAYECYLEEGCLEEIVEWVVSEVEDLKATRFIDKIEILKDYNKAKRQLFVRLLNAENNKEELDDAIFEMVGDIAKVLYFKISEKDGCVMSLKVNRDCLKEWGMSEAHVMEAALLNTACMYAPRIYKMEKMFFDPDYCGEEINERIKLEKGPLGNCLSTSVTTNGAVAVFLPGVAKKLGELLDSDFYLVFTSIHELMIHSVKNTCPDRLSQILADTVEESTRPEDYLTSAIYRYYRDADCILPVSDGKA